jgi:peptidoglycan/LPS O-acetylase OafA/YrhL
MNDTSTVDDGGAIGHKSGIDLLLGKLSRRTSSGRYIPEIDGLRFVAIGLVLLYHSGAVIGVTRGDPWIPPFGDALAHHGTWLTSFLGPGWFGVELFFVISGFILALPFAAHALAGERKVSLRAYFLRRLTRLEPPYLIALTLFFVVAGGGFVLLPHYAAGLGYQHGTAFGAYNPINGAFWSLEIEVQFYLLVPALALLFRIPEARNRRMAMVALALIVMAVNTALVNDDPRMALTVTNFLQYFLAGFLLADIYVSEWRQSPSVHRRWDLASIVGWPVLLLGASARQAAIVSLAWPGLVVLLYCAAFRGPATRKVLSNRWLITIGGMCYSIYLLHYPLMILLARVTAGLGNAQLLLFVPACVLAGAIFFAVIERPCMQRDWPQRLLSWLRARRTEPVDAAMDLGQSG